MNLELEVEGHLDLGLFVYSSVRNVGIICLSRYIMRSKNCDFLSCSCYFVMAGR